MMFVSGCIQIFLNVAFLFQQPEIVKLDITIIIMKCLVVK